MTTGEAVRTHVVEADALEEVPRADERLETHEAAAHDRRNWVRLTYECNDRCIFCLDSNTHDGEIRSPEEVKRQILDGRKTGSTRLILSGGEPTIHPKFVEFVRLGHLTGYEKVQTVTNGRMFSYGDFLKRSIDAGLGEITFSIHGPNARVHDALVGVKGAFDEEIKGLENALADGRVIVNIDVCVNRGNVKVLPELIETFVNKGVREFDLLQVIPFGRAFAEGRDTLFYDLEEAAPYLKEAFSWSTKPNMHIWLNRFPPEHTEGFEALIQDPYKLNDEVRGRRREFERQISEGIPLDCREPERCKYCYLSPLCDELESEQARLANDGFSRVRLAPAPAPTAASMLRGDPASDRRAKTKRHLPMVSPDSRSLKERVRAGGIDRAVIVAANVGELTRVLRENGAISNVDLELSDYEGLDDADFGRCVNVDSVYAGSPSALAQLLELKSEPALIIALTQGNLGWLKAHADDAGTRNPRFRQPRYDRLTDHKKFDVSLDDFRKRFPGAIVENLPPCLGGARVPGPSTLDSALLSSAGTLDIFQFTDRYIQERFVTKSLRCKSCSLNDECQGPHINFVRAHGYAQLNPL